MSEKKVSLEEMKKRIREHLLDEAKIIDDASKMSCEDQIALGVYVVEVAVEVAEKYPNYRKGILNADSGIAVMKSKLGGASKEE